MSRAIDADAFGANAVGRHVGLCVIGVRSCAQTVREVK